MAKFEIKRDYLLKAKDRSNLTPDERTGVEAILGQFGSNIHTVHVRLSDFPIAYLRALLDDARLTPNQRAVLSMHVYGMSEQDIGLEKIYDAVVSSPVEFGSNLQMLSSKTPNCEYFLNGRWYPVILHVQFMEDENKVTRAVIIRATLSLCECSFGIGYFVHRDLFLDEQGQSCGRTVLDILHHFKFRRMQTTAGEFNLKLVRAERAARTHGQVVIVSGPVIVASESAWWSGFESRALGTPEQPSKAVVEDELEVSEEQRRYNAPYGRDEDGVSRLPFIRIFSLETKSFAYADIDDIAHYEFDTSAMRRLQLPPQMLSILTRVFSTPIEGLFGDLIQGKHGGVVILASGNPGVGKTLTAEIYAEKTERPLYVLELGELGTNASQVEENLRRVFARVTRWNAVLQFDECEIFLARRGEDLERSAIVGIFLRLLDYYRGILFLTTNRPDMLDYAVLSRVMLKLNYPDLDQESRGLVWKTMFTAAGLSLISGTIEELARIELNGRQIRNLTRLAKILHPEGQLTLEEMQTVVTYGSVVAIAPQPRS